MDIPSFKKTDERRPPRRMSRVCTFSLAIHLRKYGGRLLRHPRSGARECLHLLAFRQCRQSHWICRSIRRLDGRVARMTGTSSEFGKELRLAGRRDYIRRGSSDAGVDVGISPDAAGRAHGLGLEHQLTQLGAIAAFLVPDGRCQPPGAVQHYFEPTAFESRAGQGRNILLACRFRRAPEWLRRWCTFSLASSGFLVQGDPVAGNGGGSGLPDGEHMALL